MVSTAILLLINHFGILLTHYDERRKKKGREWGKSVREMERGGGVREREGVERRQKERVG